MVSGGHEHWRHGETRLSKMILELSHEMEISYSRKGPAKWRRPQVPSSFDTYLRKDWMRRVCEWMDPRDLP